MLRRQSLIALAVAITLGLVAVYLANIFLDSTSRRDRISPEGMTKVAVAAVRLDYGVEVTPEKVKFVDLPVATLPQGTFRTLASLLPTGKRRVALRPIAVNQPLLASDLSGAGKNASIAALLPDGKRAVAVRINAVSGVAGFVKPNDSVDVLITRQATGPGRNEPLTDVLLQDVRVMAIDQDAKGKAAPDVGRTATLEVTPIDAQKLALGQQVGELSLVLRKPGADQDNVMVETVSLDDLRYNIYGSGRYQPQPMSMAGTQPAPPRTVVRVIRERAPVRRVAPAPRPSTSSVEVVRGTAQSNYEVGGYGS